MGLVDRKLPMMRLANIYKVARARLVDHRCLLPHGDEIENPNWESIDYMA